MIYDQKVLSDFERSLRIYRNLAAAGPQKKQPEVPSRVI
jgi:hypothetical protein